MKTILLFAGTTEGRKLAEWLTGYRARVHVCVATEYGESLLPHGNGITVSHRRMDRTEMCALMERVAPDFVIDATHPYAVDVTENIRAACERSGCSYLRLRREETVQNGTCGEKSGAECLWVGNVQEAVAYLSGTKGNILTVTGSKEIGAFTALADYRERLYARVLSLTDVVSQCEKLGIRGQHLICMQGPFSMEMNLATLRQYRIAYMVTKESGEAGGFLQKYEAAARAGVTLIVIGRPSETGGATLEEVCEMLRGCLEPCDGDGSQSKELRDESDARIKEPDAEENMQKEPAAVYLTGIGTGAGELFTGQAEEICRSADLIVGAKRMVEAVREAVGSDADTFVSYRTEEITQFLCAHPQYRRVAVAFSGDVGFYSGARRLKTALEENGEKRRIVLIPGISSVVCFAAKLGVSWEDARLMSMHGRACPVISAIRDSRKLFLLAGDAAGIRSLCGEMTDYGYGDLRMWIGTELSYPTERIFCGSARTLADYDAGGLAVVYIENPDGARAEKHGIRDETLIRGDVPMTKEEVRTIAVSKLRLREDSIVYDVGAGTGSVAAEAALCAARGHVYAVEENPEAVKLIRLNRRQLKADNLTVVEGRAPMALETLPAPDAVFIGGSKGELESIIFKTLEKNPVARIVLSAISLETVAQAVQILRTLKADERIAEEEIVQISVAKARTVGNYHMMHGQNPVFLISFTGTRGE